MDRVRHAGTHATRTFGLTGAVWGLGLLVTMAVWATPDCTAVHDLPTNTACGLVLSKPGCYNLNNNIQATSSIGDCIQIASSDVALNLNGNTIRGAGGSSGIHILAVNPSTGTPISGVTVVGGTGQREGIVSDFGTGVLIEASSAKLGEVFSRENEGPGIVLNAVTSATLSNDSASDNLGNGIEVNGGRGNTISGGQTEYNAGNGIVLSSSSGNGLSNLFSYSNQVGFNLVNSNSNSLFNSFDQYSGLGFKVANSNSNRLTNEVAYNDFYGFEFSGSTSNVVAGYGGASYSGMYGIYLKSSSNNEISNTSQGCNGTADIYIGCSDTGGPSRTSCAPAAASAGNGIDSTTGYTCGNNPYGIAVDIGNEGNAIVDNDSSTHTVFDVDDLNACGANTWFANSFSTANKGCLH